MTATATALAGSAATARRGLLADRVSDPGIHVVKRGENATRIAQEHGVSLEALSRANPQVRDIDVLRVGQELQIPGRQAAPALPASVPTPPRRPNDRSSAGVRPGEVAPAALRAGLEQQLSAPVLRRGAQGAAVEDLQRRLGREGFYEGRPDGIFGPNTEGAVRRFQASRPELRSDGVVGPRTWAALSPAGARAPGEAGAASSNARPAGRADGTSLNVPFEASADALSRARRSAVGQRLETETGRHAETYRRASELTGVPAELIGAVHVNESGQGTYRPSTRGPESGYGLDPRHVTTAWGNQQLARHGLGRWERGTNTPRSQLQSAVIAAEHLKRQAHYVGVEVGPNMSQGDLAGLVTGYVQGINAGRRASQSGRSWMLDVSDANPHPRHPGGTSIGRGGRTIRVAPSRKQGLLRWDTLLPLLSEQLRASTPRS